MKISFLLMRSALKMKLKFFSLINKRRLMKIAMEERLHCLPEGHPLEQEIMRLILTF